MHKICLLPGDGIGPEVMCEALKVLQTVAVAHGLQLECEEGLIGGDGIDYAGSPLPDATLELARASDAVLLAAVGGPKWDSTDPEATRPEQGLFALRAGLGTYANIRPVRLLPELADACPLRDAGPDDIDLVIVRELTGGIYFGAKGRECDVEGAAGDCAGRAAFDACDYFEHEIARVARCAFELARTRRGQVCSVDKANVLETSRLWREVVCEVAADYPDVELSHLRADAAAARLVSDPAGFDVVLTDNLFGDILSDEAGVLTGSLGMLSSASFGAGPALYEPVHGSAPDIAGYGIANPLAMIDCVAWMFEASFSLPGPAREIRAAVRRVLAEGWRTRDLCTLDTPAERIVDCAGMGDLVCAVLAGMSR